jgi:hypothetical protein
MFCSGPIARKSNMVIRPLGAINNNGDNESLEIFNWIALKTKIAVTITIAHINVSIFKICSVWIR